MTAKFPADDPKVDSQIAMKVSETTPNTNEHYQSVGKDGVSAELLCQYGRTIINMFTDCFQLVRHIALNQIHNVQA